jgi:hypothetical protein
MRSYHGTGPSPAALAAVGRHVQIDQRHGEREQAREILLGVERKSELAEQVGRHRDRGAGQGDRQHVRELGHGACGPLWRARFYHITASSW